MKHKFIPSFYNVLEKIDKLASGAKHIDLSDKIIKKEFEEHLQNVTADIMSFQHGYDLEDICETLLSYVQKIKKELLNDLRMSFFTSFALMIGGRDFCWKLHNIYRNTDNYHSFLRFFVERAYVYSISRSKDEIRREHLANNLPDSHYLVYQALLKGGVEIFLDVYLSSEDVRNSTKEYFSVLVDMSEWTYQNFKQDRTDEILAEDFDIDTYSSPQN